jgi:hypothetical protein
MKGEMSIKKTHKKLIINFNKPCLIYLNFQIPYLVNLKKLIIDMWLEIF